MGAILINSKILKENKVAELKQCVDSMNRKPKLVIISASDDKASENYIRNKVKIGAEIGIDVEVLKEERSVTTVELGWTINQLNMDKDVDAIILQLPVYPHLDSKTLIQSIHPSKDADCFSSHLLGELLQGNGDIKPCTPQGVLNLLEQHKVDVVGKDVVVIGRSTHVGLSLSVLLTQKGATVTTCHSKTVNLKEKVSNADIVVSCVGSMELIDPTWMKTGSVLIGVGISVDENFKQQTDYNVDAMLELSKCSMVGDRLNTTGTATVLALMENVVKLANN